MNFYGVGVKLGGYSDFPKDILQECLHNNIWYMGFHEGCKTEYEQLIQTMQPGDVLYAKSLHQSWKEEMRLKAIGIVTADPLPNNYQHFCGVSVIWITIFEPNVNLKYLNLNFIEKINRRNTVFLETDKRIIEEIKRLMKYNAKEDNFHAESE